MAVVMDGGSAPPKKPKPKTSTLPATDTSVGGNQGTKTTQELKKSTKVERLGYATIGARLDARDRRTRDLIKETRPEIFSAARDAGYSKEDARELTREESRQLNKRADSLHAGLLQIAPDLAADLLFSDIPTDELPEASAAAHEAARLYVQAQRKKAERAWLEQMHSGQGAFADAGLSDLPVEQMNESSIRAKLHELDQPEIQKWLDELAEFKDDGGLFSNERTFPQAAREAYLQRLYVIATHPEIFEGHVDGAMQEAYNALVAGRDINIYAKIGKTEDGELVYVPDDDDKSALQLGVEGLGQALAAPAVIPGAIGGAALRGVGAEDLADWFGEKARAVESGVGYGIRSVEGVAVGALGSIGSLENKFDDYTYSWQEFKAGKATPISSAFFDATGMRREDNEGLAAFLDMGADLLLAEVGIRGGALLKRGRTVPGVRMDGMEFLTKERLGRTYGDRLVKDIEAAPPGKIKSTLIAKWKGMDASLAEALSNEWLAGTGKDGALRVAASYIDDIAEFELPKVRSRLEQIDAEIAAQSRNAAAREISGQEPVGASSPITERTGEYVHETPIRNLESIKSGGIEARFDKADPGRKFVSARDATNMGPVPPGQVRFRFRSDQAPLRQGPSRTIKFKDSIIPDDLIEVEFAPGEGMTQSLAAKSRSLGDTATMDALLAERTTLWQRIADLEARRPVYQFPRPSAMRGWMRGARGRNTRLGRIMNNIFAETGKVDLSKLTDDFTPKSRGITYRKIRHNPDEVMDAVRKEMNVAKVPREGQVAIIEEMLAIRSPQQMFTWAENLENYLMAGATRGHTRALTTEMYDTFKFAPRSYEERISSPVTRTYDTVSGPKVAKVENSLNDATGAPMLTRPTQFLNEFYLPDMGLLREATSTVRYLDRWSKTQPWLVKAGWESLHTPAKLIKTAATAIRHVVRPSVLLSPRLWGKIQFDQTLRRIAEGYTNKRWIGENVHYTIGGIPITPKYAKPLLKEFGMDETALGSLIGDAENAAKTIPTRVNTTRIDPNPRNVEAVRVVESRIDQLLSIAEDPLMRRYITEGPEATLAYLRNSPDTRLGRWFREDYEPYLAAHGKTVEDWFTALEQEITGATFNNVALRRALGSGKWEAGGRYTTGAGGEAARLTNELQQARLELSRTEAAVPRTELLRRIDELDRRLSSLSEEPLESNSFSIKDRDAMKAQIFKMWEERPQGFFPDEVLVNRKLPKFEVRPPKDLYERLLARTSKISKFLYGGLRPMGRFDYSRRSTFTAVFRQTRESLIERFERKSGGVAPTKGQLARMEEEAAQRAAYITSDLHYDITARSSFDQAMKDLFWFSSVYREQLVTWGYKIPSRSYWPIGAPLRLHEAFAILDGLKGMGVLEWDEYQYRDKDGTLQTGRNLVATIPFLTPFLAKLQNNTEAGRLNVEGLNPLTPGTAGTLPTISPVFELVLQGAADKAPEELKPFFDVMAELFTFDGDIDEAPSFMPTLLRDAFGAIGIEVPYNQLSYKDWGEAYRKGRVQAIRWAMSDLAEDGILPPQEAEKATAADIKEVYEELGIGEIEALLSDTERGYLTGELTELEQEGLQDKLSPEQIATLVDYMDQAGTIRAEYADTAEPGGQEYEDYLAKVDARADHYRNTNVVLNLLGSAIFPGRFTDANGVTTAGEEFYAEKQKQLDAGLNYEDGSIYDWQDAYIRKHPEAYPYSVGAHPGKYGTPTYDNQKTTEPSLFIEKALEQSHYWMDKAKKDPETGEIKVDDDVPEGDKPVVEARFRERDLVNLATTRTVDIASIKEHDLDALALPKFKGATDLLRDFQRAARILEVRRDADSTDSEVATLYKQYENNLKNVSARYGEDGAKMLQWFKATPAERLRRADYFVTPVSERTITQANAIASRATSDGSGLFSEEDIWGRINFYRQIEHERKQNPAFDRELRRAELALGENGLEGRVATYEYLFFNIDEEWFGHFGTIAEGLK